MSALFYDLVRAEVARQLEVDPVDVLLGVRDGRIVAAIRGRRSSQLHKIRIECELRGTVPE